MAAKKKATKKKTASKPAAAKKSSTKKTSTKKTSKKQASKKAASAQSSSSADASTEKPAAATPKKGASSLDVNISHLFSLRPRVNTSFKPGDLNTAKHQLKDDTYKDIQAAARAVAERALELNHEVSRRGGTKRKF